MRALAALRSLRARLMALLLVGAVPLAAMAGLVAWQDYQAALLRAEDSVRLFEQSASERHRAAIDEVWQELEAIAAAPALGVDAGACERVLREVMLLHAARYRDLALVGGDGRPLCRASADPTGPASWIGAPDSQWTRLAVATHGFSVRALNRPGPSGEILIGAAYPVLGDAQRFLGAAAALLRVDWLEDARQPKAIGYHFWLIDPGGGLIPAPGASASVLPRASDLPRLRSANSGLAMLRSASGRPFFYAVSDLGGGLRLLVAQDATASRAAARAVLYHRAVGLGLLLVLGIAAATLGANLALVQPIERLTGGVERWRAGAPFDAGKLDHLPDELNGLCRAFGHATDALSKREGELRRALEKQELLSQEIHHRVKNNLQVVASLLNLQAGRIRQPEAKAEFQLARDRVRALATLHRHLYLQGELQTINMRSFLSELCGQLDQALGAASANRIGLRIEAADLRIASDQAVPLALIVTETVGNAIKYAFPGNRAGNILVRLTPEEKGATLVIEDDGVGLPPGRSDTETGVRGGIGLKLVRGLARQLGATLTIDERQGTRYEIAIPRLNTPVAGSEAPAA